MIVQCAASSHTGRVRGENEDVYAIHGVVGRSGSAALRADTESDVFRRYGLLVADGMGGRAGGAMASRIVLARHSELYYATPRGECTRDELRAEIRSCVDGAGRALAAAAAGDQSLDASGTTLCGMVLQAAGEMALFWAGDSKAVWVTSRSARQITVDHALRPAYRAEAEEAGGASRGDSLLRFIDAHGGTAVDFAPEATWVGGERYVLGTDGWHGPGRGLSWEGVVRAMRDAPSAVAACEWMVFSAVEQDGADNATALAVWCGG